MHRMIHIAKKILSEKKGAALVLMTFALSVIMASAAMVLDVGSLYYNKTQVVNAVDASVLAGVQALPDDQDQAVQLARDYGAKNNVNDLTVTLSADHQEIRAQASRTVNFDFARLLGYDSGTVRAQAGARLEPITGARGIAPLGIPEQTLNYGESYVLKYAASDSPEGEYHEGWMGLMALQGPGAKLYLDDLKKGYDSLVKQGDVLNIQTGTVSGNTFEGVQYRIDQCKHTPACTWDHYVQGCPRILLIPVIRDYANKQVQVVSFAAFFVDSVAGMGNNNYITGKFIRYTTSGQSDPSGPDYGLKVPRLTS